MKKGFGVSGISELQVARSDAASSRAQCLRQSDELLRIGQRLLDHEGRIRSLVDANRRLQLALGHARPALTLVAYDESVNE